MRIVAFLALAVVAGCSRNDKTATPEPVGTTTVTSMPLTLATPADGELDRRDDRANGATPTHPAFTDDMVERAVGELSTSPVTGVTETVQGLSLRPFMVGDGDERAQFRVQFALLHDDDFVEHASDIDVRAEHGVVTLQGTTTTPAARTAAERIAGRQPGVAQVDNRLRIGPIGPPSGHTRR